MFFKAKVTEIYSFGRYFHERNQYPAIRLIIFASQKNVT